MIYLHTSDNSIEVSFPAHAAGEVAESVDRAGIGLQLNSGVDGYTLFLASSGTITYERGGESGSMNAWLVPQSNVPAPLLSFHLTGKWTCRST
jgi:hypothetical protein